MPRLDIYVPADVLVEMQQYTANWSRIARAAFIQHMREVRERDERDAALAGVLTDPNGGLYA